MQIFSKLRTALSLFSVTALLSLAASTDALAAGSGKSTDAPALRSIAFEHYLSGDIDAALDYYQKAIDTAARDYGQESSYIGQLYYEMGTLALDAKKFIRSEGYLQKAVQHNPNSVMARVKYAECLQLRGKSDEALNQIHAALARHSSAPEAREALVVWLQANHRTASAIHESYNLSVAANGKAVPPPVASATLAKLGDSELVAAAAPPPVAPAAIAPNSPLKLFPWMDKKSDAKKGDEAKPSDKNAAEKNPPEKKTEEKKAETTKKVEKKTEKKPAKTEKQKESKSAKQQEKAKSNKHSKSKEPKQQVEVATEELHASTAALRTTAKTIKPKKEETETSGAEEAAAPPKAKKDNTPKIMAMPNLTPIMPSKPLNRKQTMVPPPPPMVPSFGGFPMFNGGAPPPPSIYSKPPVAKTAKKPKTAAPAAAVVKEAPAEAPKAAATSSGAEEDPNFLLDWAGANAKKKGK